MVFHIALEFSDCDEPFLWKLSESGKIIGRDANNSAQRWPGMATYAGRRRKYILVRKYKIGIHVALTYAVLT